MPPLIAVTLVIAGALGLGLGHALQASHRSLHRLPRHPHGWRGALGDLNPNGPWPPRRDHMREAIDVDAEDDR